MTCWRGQNAGVKAIKIKTEANSQESSKDEDSFYCIPRPEGSEDGDFMPGGVSEVWFDSGATVTLWLDSAMRSPEGRRGSTVPGGHQGGGEAVSRGQLGAGEARQCQEDAKVDEEQRHDSPLDARVTIWF